MKTRKKSKKDQYQKNLDQHKSLIQVKKENSKEEHEDEDFDVPFRKVNPIRKKRRMLQDSSSDENWDDSDDCDLKDERVIRYLKSKERRERTRKALAKLKSSKNASELQDSESDLDSVRKSKRQSLHNPSSERDKDRQVQNYILKPKKLRRKRKPNYGADAKEKITSLSTLKNESPVKEKPMRKVICIDNQLENRFSEEEVVFKQDPLNEINELITSEDKLQKEKPPLAQTSDEEIMKGVPLHNDSNLKAFSTVFDSDSKESFMKSATKRSTKLNSIFEDNSSLDDQIKKENGTSQIYKLDLKKDTKTTSVQGTRRSRRIEIRNVNRAKIEETNSSSSSDSSISDPDITSEEEGICLFDTDDESKDSIGEDDNKNVDPSIQEKDSNENINNDDESTDSSHINNALSNPMNYAALNFCMDAREDLQTNERDIVEETLGRLRNMTNKEAFDIWIKDLSKQVEDFLQQKLNQTIMMNTKDIVNKDPYISSKKSQAAAIQIENPLCTHRESSLSSTAWTKEYRNQLKRRPVYIAHDLDSSDLGCVCDACGRSNHNVAYKVKFKGVEYDASRTYEIMKNTRHTDWNRCFRQKQIENETSFNETDEQIRASGEKLEFKVGKYCRARSELYHSLLHYKYNVFSEIGMKILGIPLMTYYDKLQTSDSRKSGRIKLKMKVKDLLKNSKFIDQQYNKYQRLIQLASEGWSFGASERNMMPVNIPWSNHEALKNEFSDADKQRKASKEKKKLKKQRKKLKKAEKKLKKAKKKMKKAERKKLKKEVKKRNKFKKEK